MNLLRDQFSDYFQQDSWGDYGNSNLLSQLQQLHAAPVLNIETLIRTVQDCRSKIKMILGTTTIPSFIEAALNNDWSSISQFPLENFTNEYWEEYQNRHGDTVGDAIGDCESHATRDPNPLDLKPFSLKALYDNYRKLDTVRDELARNVELAANSPTFADPWISIDTKYKYDQFAAYSMHDPRTGPILFDEHGHTSIGLHPPIDLTPSASAATSAASTVLPDNLPSEGDVSSPAEHPSRDHQAMQSAILPPVVPE